MRRNWISSPSPFSFPLYFVLVLVLVLVLCCGSSLVESSTSDDEEGPVCSMYLAESSTSSPEDPKWGLFTGLDLTKGDIVGSPEVAINIHNLLGNARPQHATSQTTREALLSAEFLEQYIWVPDMAGGKFELDSNDGKIVTAIPGGGVLGGFHDKLTNTDWYHSGSYHRQAIGEIVGLPHPGKGAFSPFYNVTLMAKEMMVAGAEIFLDYGENWEAEETNEQEQMTKEDYSKVDIVVDQMIDFFDKYHSELNDVSQQEIYQFLVHDILKAATSPAKVQKIIEVLPDHPQQLKAFRQEYDGSTLQAAQPPSVKRMDWLKTNGLCFDNLLAGPSTIPVAGRGAFAKRPINQGQMIVPVPLVHIPQKSIVNMYNVDLGRDSQKGEAVWFRTSDEIQGTQLLLNYCFGHKDSSMIFFPSGSLVGLINHSREQTNAKLVWSKHPMHQNTWFDVPPAELLTDGKHSYLGLMMEVVATKPIQQGDEIFLDYGDEWIDAWETHEAYWQELLDEGDCPDPWPIRALDMQNDYQNKPFEIDAHTPEHIRQMCFLVVSDIKEDATKKNWAIPKKGNVYDAENLFDCVLVDRQEAPDTAIGLPYNYTVQWTSDDGDITTVFRVPHQAIIFVDAAGYSDQFDPDSFRHVIGIPDDIFPQGPWRNLVGVEETSEE
eukprot:CAMPEP_0202454024 /NCGR_PEP_ID=MMETSP1360-20130828/11861_1 /ASSEMBLY_ACC=CAM_ASM_000848 /TAXON_ID=515479 /ORGANISM="Licmophora paradoxa, Strain CCMP2313" /LENGTH=660 /DNA_ID=CAMNT_0049073247 /DNA_START=90 /DNA_END=2072 /DNA_ORIENTATION=+